MQCKFTFTMVTACDRVGIVCRHDFLGILEPNMMEEKKGLVEFLRTAVGCFRDLPRGHIISLAQHMQQVLYFIVSGVPCAELSCAVLCWTAPCYPVPAMCRLCRACYAVHAVQYVLRCICCAVHAMLCMLCHPVHTTNAWCCI